MQVKLVEGKVPVFFLGDPRNLILTLSCAEPGPVELDFNNLPKVLQQRVLIALRDGVLEAERPFHEIFADWNTANPPVAKSQAQVAHEENISFEMQQRMQREAKIREKEEKLQSRCGYLSTLSYIQLRTSVKKETDLRLLRTLLHLEENGKGRELNIKYLVKKIKTIELKLEREIEKKTNEQLKTLKVKSSKDPLAEKFTVVESEKKTIYLSTKELVEIGLIRQAARLLATNLIDIVDAIHPAASGIGIILSDKVWIVFDREIDETSLSNGNLFVAGPDFDTWSGPDLQLFHNRPSVGSEGEILQSPGYHGLVQGTFSFERLDLSSDVVVTTRDIVGSGLLYRSKVLFTPRERLSIDTEYNVYLSGDEDATDDISSGVLSRTVFDPIATITNTSVGTIGFVGGYIGLVPSDVYHLSIAISGDISTAKFSFYRDSDPFTVYGPFKTRLSGVPLSDGVLATFTDGSYVAGDSWSVASMRILRNHEAN